MIQKSNPTTECVCLGTRYRAADEARAKSSSRISDYARAWSTPLSKGGERAVLDECCSVKSRYRVGTGATM